MKDIFQSVARDFNINPSYIYPMAEDKNLYKPPEECLRMAMFCIYFILKHAKEFEEIRFFSTTHIPMGRIHHCKYSLL